MNEVQALSGSSEEDKGTPRQSGKHSRGRRTTRRSETPRSSRSRSRSRSRDSRSPRSRSRSRSPRRGRRRTSASPEPKRHKRSNEKKEKKHKKEKCRRSDHSNGHKDHDHEREFEHQQFHPIDHDPTPVQSSTPTNHDDSCTNDAVPSPPNNDLKAFFANLHKQEAAKEPVGTLHAQGIKAQSTTARIVAEEWECGKAGCGKKNPKIHSACGKCGAMRRMSEWR